jgi:ribosomal protein S18 acetylase RimI-like enzyme
MESARLATRDDLARIVALARQGAAELRPTRGGEIWALREARAEPLEQSIGGAIDDRDQLAVVGSINATIVGFAAVHTEILRDDSELAVIDEIYVEEEARSVAVGETMMREVLAWCEARGCRGIDALALPGNRATKNFFETFGLKARGIVVHRSLLPPETADG